MILKHVLVQKFKRKRKSEKKVTLTKTCKCYKAGKLLWKNDLFRVYFNMKQTLRFFLSKTWKSEGYLEPSRASLRKIDF